MPSENQTQPNQGQDSQDREVASHARPGRGSRGIQHRTDSYRLRREQPESFSSPSWQGQSRSLSVGGDRLDKSLYECHLRQSPICSVPSQVATSETSSI